MPGPAFASPEPRCSAKFGVDEDGEPDGEDEADDRALVPLPLNSRSRTMFKRPLAAAPSAGFAGDEGSMSGRGDVGSMSAGGLKGFSEAVGITPLEFPVSFGGTKGVVVPLISEAPVAAATTL